ASLLLQSARDRLHHKHQHAALKPVPGYVTDADLDAAAALQHVIVVAADLVGRFHVAGNLDPWNARKLGDLRQHHHLDLPGHIEFRAKPQILSLQLGIETVDFLVRLAQFPRSVVDKPFEVFGVVAYLFRHAIEGMADRRDLVTGRNVDAHRIVLVFRRLAALASALNPAVMRPEMVKTAKKTTIRLMRKVSNW